MLTEGDISRIVSRIVRGYDPIAVGTFGSYAIGRARESSDLDLVVIKQTSQNTSARSRCVRSLLFGVLNPIDVHVFRPEEFEETAYEELSFAWVIVRQVRLYHWSEGADSQVPSLFSQHSSSAENGSI